MNGITVITPTGDRPLAFGLLRDHWMKDQTIKPDQWIIVDDGEYKYNTGNLPSFAEYIRRDHHGNKFSHSIGLNLEAALFVVKCDNVLIMEDDDWYSPEYISFMVNLLKQSDLAGLWGTNYYHVGVPGYRGMGRCTHAALSLTGFKKSFIPKIVEVIPGNISIDLRIWKEYRGLLVDGRNLKMQCSMKGMPGRNNAGVGRKKEHYKKDVGYNKLKAWCGDADIYIDLMENKIV